MALPASLQGVFFDFRWDQAKVWALPTPVTALPLSELAWQLSLPVWTTVPGEPRGIWRAALAPLVAAR